MESSDEFYISIIIPTYNRYEYLKETLDSLVNQLYKNFEVIIVDDYSSDETRLLIPHYSNLLNLRYYRNESNLGESASVNIGVALAKSDLIAIVNSDDPQTEIWLAEMVFEIKSNPEYIIYYPDVRIIDKAGIELSKWELPDWNETKLYTELNCISSAGAILNLKKFPQNKLIRVNEVKYPSDLFQTMNIGLYGSGYHVRKYLGTWRDSSTYKGKISSLEFARNFETECIKWFDRNRISQTVFSHTPIFKVYLYGQIWKLLRRNHSLIFCLVNFPWNNFIRNFKLPMFTAEFARMLTRRNVTALKSVFTRPF